MLVPVKKPSSVWRTLILFFAAVLTLGVFAPAIASAHSRAFLSVHDTTVLEPQHGSTTAHVKITLNHRVHHNVSVGWTTRDGTAKAGSDYVAARDRAFIRAGHKVAFANVTILADRHHHDGFTRDHEGFQEHYEFFKVLLASPRGARIADGLAIVTIVEPRPVIPTLSVHKAVAKEGSPEFFKVELSAPARRTVTFDFATHDGTAIAGQDYDQTFGHGVIDQGKSFTFVKVMTRFDSDQTEGTEFFFLKVFHVQGATVDRDHTVGIILDGPPPGV